jgi:hypothetical protein
VGVYLISEYASRGDVFGELDRRGGSMTEADAVRQVLAPFLSALEYLHLLNIIHRCGAAWCGVVWCVLAACLSTTACSGGWGAVPASAHIAHTRWWPA